MNIIKIYLTAIVLSAVVFSAAAQSKTGYDSRYYKLFPKSVSARIFASRKYSVFTMKSIQGNNLRYLPNNNLAAGIGASYNNLSVNIAYGLSFLNKKERGKTKSIDLQAHLYSRLWTNDLYAQQYSGFYTSHSTYSVPVQTYYTRPDVKVQLLGLSRYRIFNSRKFSYRAAFLQTEWQKKSAGSILAGFEMYYSRIKGDSNFVPLPVQVNYKNPGVSRVSYAGIGPGIGYAYTLVVRQQFFATGSLVGNLNLSYIKETGTAVTRNYITLTPLVTFRAAAGYNAKIWSVTANWIALNLHMKGTTGNKYLEQTGNYRFIIARRFKAGKKLQKRLRAMDKVFKEGMDMLPALPVK